MQTLTFTLSNEKPSSKDTIENIVFKDDERFFVITCDDDIDLAIFKWTLTNGHGDTNTKCFYKEHLGKQNKKEPYHTILIFEKGTNDALKKSFQFTIYIT